MKSSSSSRHKRTLRARAATVDREYDDYGAEPNMKLSHAFMVVLALHIIAVGGLFAFNKAKANHSKMASSKLSEETVGSQTVPSQSVVAPLASSTTKEAATLEAKAAAFAKKTLGASTKLVASHQTAAPVSAPGTTVPTTAPATTGGQLPPSSSPAAPVATTKSEAKPDETASLKEYTIVKGDSPYKIAKRFHVSYDELMKINHITDARKIQIGQKLKIPAKKNK